MNSQTDLSRSLFNVVDRLSEISEKIVNCSLVKQKNNVILHTRLQTIFNLKFSDPTEQSLCEIIMRHAISAEKMSPGGFDLFIENVIKQIKTIEVGNQLKSSENILWANVKAGVAAPVCSDIDWLMSTCFNSVSIKNQSLLKHALKYAGFGGRIIVEKSQSVTSIELVKGYTFELRSLWPLNVVLERPKIACIDGIIESVSEIHHFLQEASETKEQVVLFVRGMSDDVKNTVKINYDRGTIRVIPVIVNFDLDGINTLNDVCVVSGSELISNLKGNLISSLRVKDLTTVERIVVYPSQVVVMNAKTKFAVECHLNSLLKKRESESIIDVINLIDQRVRALSSDYVIIRIPDDKDFVITSQNIDYVLRAVKSLTDYGTIVIGNKRMLTMTAVAAETHFVQCLNTLKNLGAVIT